MMGSPLIRVEGVTKSYHEATSAAVENLSFSVEGGEIVVLLGPSGCGKTMTLRLIAGFERPDTGIVEISGRKVVDAKNGIWVPPENRNVGMVFQDYALFPHLTVADNVSFGLTKLDPERRVRKTQQTLALVGLEEFANRYPFQLSGGQQQRVALARALAPGPIVILLDEPFSNLDADMRIEMRREVVKILRETESTAIFVTHDQDEAFSMADRVGILDLGVLRQIDSPFTLYHRPVNKFVARFLGHADFVPGRVQGREIITEIGSFENSVGLSEGNDVQLMIRPDDIDIVPADFGTGEIVGREFRGSESVYTIKLSSGQLLHSSQPSSLVFKHGSRVIVIANPGHLVIFSGDQVIHS